MDELVRQSGVIAQVANLVLQPIVLLGIVAGFQFINFEAHRKFAWKTWALLTIVIELPAIWALVNRTSGGLIVVDWWPWASILYAPITSLIIVLFGQLVLDFKRGVGFAWKTWVVVSLVVFAAQTYGVMKWRGLEAESSAKTVTTLRAQ